MVLKGQGLGEAVDAAFGSDFGCCANNAGGLGTKYLLEFMG